MFIIERLITIVILALISVVFTAIVGRKLSRNLRGMLLTGCGIAFAFLSSFFGEPSPFREDPFILVLIFGIVAGVGALQSARLSFVQKFLGEDDGDS